ncbi:RluA family pseudouridine synthase [Tepidiforma flava]|uniref:Pseudouridine synthase n=1 Tax=Tepidiforma flava TaxID=3004094 RepID=A0ABY7M6D9_9CHLR|nr:RluA family pseudouridine synthase [Tepidiforma flava]WBL36074.1 RluA family pseudouridine synthase [Tepidiforma flava]
MDHGVPAAGEGRTVELVAAERCRLDAFVSSALEGLSRARAQRLIERGLVRVNGAEARKSAAVAPGDRVVVVLEPTAHAPGDPGVDLPVVYEDDLVAAVAKPAGLAVHGAPGDAGPSVAGWWLAKLGGAAGAFDAERPGIVHRLDKETSGVLLLAKTPAAQAALSRAFEERLAKKVYLAVVDGVPAQPRAVIEAPIDRDPRDRTRMAVTSRGRPARTEYRVVASGNGRAVLEVYPETGRTHQIRVHLAAAGTPVAQDAVYGRAEPGGRQLLHALQIAVPHPAGGVLRAGAPAPADLLAAIRAIAGETVASRYAAVPPATLERGEDS